MNADNDKYQIYTDWAGNDDSDMDNDNWCLLSSSAFFSMTPTASQSTIWDARDEMGLPASQQLRAHAVQFLYVRSVLCREDRLPAANSGQADTDATWHSLQLDCTKDV